MLEEWNWHIQRLKHSSLKLKEGDEELKWTKTKGLGVYTTKM
jgi:hypothetical protein